MNREDMITAIRIIFENNSDPKIAAVKVFDFWAVSPSHKVKDGKLIHKDLGTEYK